MKYLPPVEGADDADTGPTATQALMAEINAVQEHNRRVIRTLSPLGLHLLKRRLRTGRCPVPPQRLTAAVTPRARTRERRPGARRRTASSSRTASNDPGDNGPLDDHASVLIRGVACPQCAAPLHTDFAGADHCGGCAISWWEGVL